MTYNVLMETLNPTLSLTPESARVRRYPGLLYWRGLVRVTGSMVLLFLSACCTVGSTVCSALLCNS